MTNSQSKLYSTSAAKHPSCDGSAGQTIFLGHPYLDTLNQIMISGVCMAVSYCNHADNLQHLFNPIPLPTVDGTTPRSFIGNTIDEIGCFAPGSIDLRETHFLVLVSEADMDALGLDKDEPVKNEVATAEGLSGNYYLRFCPKVHVGHMTNAFPVGPFSNEQVQDEFESNGQGAGIWHHLTKLAMSKDLQAMTQRIFTHESTQASLNTIAPNRPATFSYDPAVVVTCGNHGAFPNEVSSLQKIFSPKPAATPSPGFGGTQQLTTGADIFEKYESDHGLAVLELLGIAGSVDCEKSTIDVMTLGRSIPTNTLTTLKSAPPKGRPDVLYRRIATMTNEIKDNGDSTNIMTNVTISILSSTGCKNILAGNLQTTLLESARDTSQLVTFGAKDALPQDTSDPLIKQAIDEENNDHAARTSKTTTPNTPKVVKQVLASLRKMSDTTGPDTLINLNAIMQILHDFEKMKAQGTPAIFDQVLTFTFKWMHNEIKNKLHDWRILSKNEMPLFGAYLFGIVERMMCAFGTFATSPNNVHTFQQDDGDLSTLDVSEITKFLTAFKIIRDDISNKQYMHVPLTAAPGFIRGIEQAPAIQAPAPIPAPAPAPATSPATGSGRNQRTPGDEHRAPKKAKITPQPATAGMSGMLFLAVGKTPEEAVPDGVNACPKFVAKGHACPNAAACKLKHYTQLSAVPKRELSIWCAHLHDTKAGYFNFWKAKDMDTNSPPLAGLVGGQKSPPKST